MKNGKLFFLISFSLLFQSISIMATTEVATCPDTYGAQAWTSTTYFKPSNLNFTPDSECNYGESQQHLADVDSQQNSGCTTPGVVNCSSDWQYQGTENQGDFYRCDTSPQVCSVYRYHAQTKHPK